MKVGSIVECVSNVRLPLFCPATTKTPTVGCIYTIRDMTRSPRSGSMHVHLEEIINHPWETTLDGWGEIWFGIWHFRELLPPEECDIEQVIKEPEPALV